MTKITNTKLYRMLERTAQGFVPRQSVIPATDRMKTTITCNGIEFEQYVTVGEFVNKKKRCKRLLREYYKPKD